MRLFDAYFVFDKTMLLLKILFIKFLIVFYCKGSEHMETISPDSPTPEWISERFFTNCLHDELIYSNCQKLAVCTAENVLKFAKYANAQCVSKADPKVRCILAPTAFVTLEKLREFLMDSAVGRDCAASEKIRSFCSDAMFDSEQDPNIKLAAAFNKFFSLASVNMRDDSEINREISDAEVSRNLHSLLALMVSFGLPGLFSVCEPSHLKTTLFLQIVALVAVSFYQFVRKGLLWTLLSVGSCFLVLLIQFGLLYLFRSKYREEKPLIFKE